VRGVGEEEGRTVRSRKRGEKGGERDGSAGGGKLPVEAAQGAACRGQQFVGVVAVEHDFGFQPHEGNVTETAVSRREPAVPLAQQLQRRCTQNKSRGGGATGGGRGAHRASWSQTTASTLGSNRSTIRDSHKPLINVHSIEHLPQRVRGSQSPYT
jgi:hypothetical protein